MVIIIVLLITGKPLYILVVIKKKSMLFVMGRRKDCLMYMYVVDGLSSVNLNSIILLVPNAIYMTSHCVLYSVHVYMYVYF